MTITSAEQISVFNASIGINTHDDLIGSIYQNTAAMENALSYIGITAVRDTYDSLDDAAEYKKLAQDLNVKYDFYIALGTAGVPWQISQIESDPSIVSYVEGFNESDNWWQTYNGLTGIAATQAVQAAVYTAVKSDAQLSGVGVIQSSFGKLSTFSSYGNQSAYADYANTHSYFGTGNNPDGGNWENYLINLADTVTPGKPTITTEAGYYTMPGAADGVSQQVQAKYLLDLIFEQAKAGVSLTYLYELADNFADPGNTNSEDHYGLFNADWTPKLAAIALHNLMAITADPDTGGVRAGSLNYTLQGMASTMLSSLFEKSDGTFVIALWNDVRLSGPIVQSDIVVAPVTVTLALTQPYSIITIYDPLLGTTAVQTFINAQTVQIAVPDHPVIVEISNSTTMPTIAPVVINAPTMVYTMPGNPVLVTGLAVQNATTGTITATVTAGVGTLAIENAAGHVMSQGVKQITLTGTEANVDAELATLTYTGGASTGSNMLSVTVQDAAGHTITQAIGVTVTAPAAAAVSGGALLSVPSSFAMTAATTATFPNVVLSDPYAATHAGTVTLTVAALNGGLQVSANGATLVGNGSGALTVSGSFAQVSAALATLTYTAGASLGVTTLTFSVHDAIGRVSTQTIAVTAVTPPTLAAPTTVQSQTTTITAIHGVALTDSYAITNADAVTVTVSDAHGLLAMNDASAVVVAGSGTTSITLSGTVEQVDAKLATLTYTTYGAASNDTITVAAVDLYGGTVTDKTAVIVTSNAPPTVTQGAIQLFASSSASLKFLQVAGLTSTATATPVTVTVTSSFGVLKSTDAEGTVTGSGTGQFTVSGTVAQVDATLAALLYQSGATAGTNALSVKVVDAFGGVATSTLPVTVYSTPTATAPVPAVLRTAGATTLTGFSIADSYTTAQGGTITAKLVDTYGTLTLAARSGVSITGSGSDTLTVSGTLALVNTALSYVGYVAGPVASADVVTLVATDTYGGNASVSTTLTAAVPVTTVPSGVLISSRSSVLLAGIQVKDMYASTKGGSLIVNISDIANMGGTLRVVDTTGALQTGNGSYSLRLVGTLAQVNASLATLSYTAGSSTGVDQVQVNVWNPLGASETSNIAVGVGSSITTINGVSGLQQVVGFTASNGTILDLRQMMATTGWNGQTSTLSHYLSVRAATGGSILSIMPNGNSATSYDIAQFKGGSVSLADIQLHGWLAPDASTATSGVTITDTGAGLATISGSSAGVAAVLAADPHTATAATLADPGTNSIAVIGWNNVFDAGAGINFLNGLQAGDIFRLNGSGQGLDMISGFSLVNGDVLDLHRALAGLAVASDQSNLGQYITTSTTNGNTTLYLDVQGGGHGSAIGVLQNVTTNLDGLISHHSITI